ncbi:organic solute transporter subunit alpha [Paramormyrops kingsleyae]|uniref:Organic solute transporter subunit alpha-like n=1 Tax=Paramormyrops kingsleyae TaxID=1676925 RepID=A0A3B3SFT1_9TELE|nr:organic solute transporter subunit alpha-like [Paramormyrops kingsleyae]XP_023675121.1 organic solute transporter subunit alpha-like [Paramormyrops kingsleyae]XP_023675122.1 organic solute transporter subunit alpha-like [Paramormyrops kingsleyae]
MMGRGSNCSWPGAEIPLSSELFAVIKNELWVFLFPAGLAFIMLTLFLEEIGFFLRHAVSSRRRRLSLWILGMYPVFGLTSITALYVPRSSSLCNFIASVYHSTTLLKFMGLITDFFGGKDRMLEALAGQPIYPNPFPCCFCCCIPLITFNRTTLGWMMVAVLQLSVVRTILFFITLVLWTDEQYDYGDVDSVNPNLYVNAIIAISTFLSFYGYLLFYKATKRVLHGYGLQAKFVCIIVVLVLCGLQSGILETMGALKLFPCTPPFSYLMRSQLIYHYSVIVEMFCISLFARHTFRKVEPSLEEGRRMGLSNVIGHSEKEVQTEQLWPLAGQINLNQEELWSGCSGGGTGNPGYNSDSEDTLCRIEYAPLDCFPIPLQLRPRQLPSPENKSPKPTEDIVQVEHSVVSLTAEIHNNDTTQATVV